MFCIRNRSVRSAALEVDAVLVGIVSEAVSGSAITEPTASYDARGWGLSRATPRCAHEGVTGET
jgi:hypothetical protein